MHDKINQIDLNELFDEVDREFEEAFSAPEGTQKYLDELDNFFLKKPLKKNYQR